MQSYHYRARMLRGERMTIIDTHNPKAWALSGQKIPGAIRIPADEIKQHVHEIPRNLPVVAYCT